MAVVAGRVSASQQGAQPCSMRHALNPESVRGGVQGRRVPLGHHTDRSLMGCSSGYRARCRLSPVFLGKVSSGVGKMACV